MLYANLLWSEGKYIALFWSTLIILGYILHPALLIAAVIGLLFSIYFFRNPERFPEAIEANVLICPSDGKIVDIQSFSQEQDTGHQLEGYDQKISIFLSPFDVHVNWIPYAGKITEITHKPGLFVAAYLPKSSILNERNDIMIETKHGKICVRQIAGTIARRICCWLKPEKSVYRGEIYGMIRFGSRIDIFLPKSVTLSLKVGDRVYGGQTVLGRWSTCSTQKD